jgi:hypothetical protein
LFIRQRAAYWKQRGKFKSLREGDSNTKFFHARASMRQRKNTIAALSVDGRDLVSHEDKSAALADYFTTIIGTADSTRWNFDVNSLYIHDATWDASFLVEQFTEAEALAAVRSMNPNSAPGPDGLGPAWYKTAWAHVKGDVMALLSSFHDGNAELDRINRAHIVLLPKLQGACHPKDFRPISLQNCPVKIITKILTTRLQRSIQLLVDVDQTGFIKGRSISENFVYATELVQHCHRRKLPTAVIKLDFAKAFDSVAWDSLLTVLQARKFPPIWISWMKKLLDTSHSAVLVNGCPSRWIKCKRGVRQGDALSPYLFLLMADVLQKMIKQDGGIRHPAIEGSCPVLQYADDTLLLVRAEVTDIRRLKKILDDFALASGLKINFNKSTLVPMHVPEQKLLRIVRSLQCQQGTFPQTYLGLPLSNVKLNLSAFAPLISKTDRRLAGWQAALLNHQGRLVLINSVLDGLATYLMQALVLPPGIVDKLDSKRRAFLWTGTDKTSGAKCLVRWENAQKPKEEGGLGIRNLATQNACLLLKLLHRLHHPDSSAWAAWARGHVDLASMEGGVDGNHWEALRDLLPAYRCITKVTVGDGRSTSFWWDAWTEDAPLAQRFPCLFSHCTNHNVSVFNVCSDGLDSVLVARLSLQAIHEKAEVSCIINSTHLQQHPDERSSFFAANGHRLDTSQLYRTSTQSGHRSQSYSFLWKNYAPPKVKFFGWLLIQERIHCRANLAKKNILDDAMCGLCGQSEEDCEHLIFRCPVASSFWAHLGWDMNQLPPIGNLWEIPRPDQIPLDLFSTFIMLCCWHIWNHRHDVVFRQLQPSLPRLLAACKASCRQWSCRLRTQDKWVVEHWCNMFVMA